MEDKRKAAAFIASSVFALAAACFAGMLLPRLAVPLVAMGFVGYVLLGRRAMILLRADEKVFVHGSPGRPRGWARSPVAAGLAAGTIASFALTLGRAEGPESGARRPIPRESAKGRGSEADAFSTAFRISPRASSEPPDHR